MRLHINTHDGAPIYQQIVLQIKHLVASGRLKPGDEIPPIRTLAEQLLINPNTVARAYRELETIGVLTSRRGAGTYVSDKGSPLAYEERLRLLSERVDGMLVEAHQLGFNRNDVVSIVSQRINLLENMKEKKTDNGER